MTGKAALLSSIALGLSGCGNAVVMKQRIIAPDTFAIAFAPDAGHAAVEEKARELCQGKQMCKVLGWSDEGALASALPMTEREAAALKLNLTINRATGLDQALWT